MDELIASCSKASHGKKCKKCNVKTIIMSKMTSHCAGTEQEIRESEIGRGKREEVWFKTRAKHRERWSSGDKRWKTVPQMSGCDRKRFVTICWCKTKLSFSVQQSQLYAKYCCEVPQECIRNHLPFNVLKMLSGLWKRNPIRNKSQPPTPPLSGTISFYKWHSDGSQRWLHMLVAMEILFNN